MGKKRTLLTAFPFRNLDTWITLLRIDRLIALGRAIWLFTQSATIHECANDLSWWWSELLQSLSVDQNQQNDIKPNNKISNLGENTAEAF